MKKEILAILILVGLFSLQNNIDIEDRNYGLILGMDLKASGEWRATYSFADLSKVAETQGKGAESVSLSISGTSLEEIENKYNTFQDTELEYGHLKALIIGKSIIEDEEQYENFMKEMTNSSEYSRNMLVFCADEALEVVKLDEETTGLLADKLKRLEERHISAKTITLKTVLQGYWEGKEVRVPSLRVYRGSPQFIGYETLPINKRDTSLETSPIL